MATREHLLEIAGSKVGTGETPPGSNCNVFSKSLNRPCEAWCADSVVSIMREAGIKLPSESAYTPTMYNGFVGAGTAVMDLAHGLQPGDVIFFDFTPPFSSRQIQHVGIFVRYIDGANIETLEGNTSSGEGGSQDNGDGYYRRHRPLKFIVGAGRPPYAPAGTPPPPPLPPHEGVRPEYDPPLVITVVSGTGSTNGGAWLLGQDGGIFSFGGAPFYGSPVGQDYWNGRHAKVLETKDNGGYRIVAQESAPGSGYDYPGGGNIISTGPEFNPPVTLRIVADLRAPEGGIWILQEDGAIFTFGAAEFHGGANGKDYFAGRKAAQLEAATLPDGKNGYVIIASSGERYGPVL